MTLTAPSCTRDRACQDDRRHRAPRKKVRSARLNCKHSDSSANAGQVDTHAQRCHNHSHSYTAELEIDTTGVQRLAETPDRKMHAADLRKRDAWSRDTLQSHRLGAGHLNQRDVRLWAVMRRSCRRRWPQIGRAQTVIKHPLSVPDHGEKALLTDGLLFHVA
jgi:hypothetical protein